ncbi:SH3 domain-containing protein [Cognatiluteimonas telluris]|uniref:C40 family peptidase n=1 Tax=Cognatiluteimonas telluris TaxID=1104775 RepID=UPI0014088A5D
MRSAEHPRRTRFPRRAARGANIVLLGVLCIASNAMATGTQATALVPGIREAYLTPAYWIARLHHPDAALLDRAAIARQNARLTRLDPTMHDLRTLPAQLPRAQVAEWITTLSTPPVVPMFDASGAPVAPSMLDAIVANRALDTIPEVQPIRYGLVVRRAALRGFPSAARMFSTPGDTDIDRFQESALFPGTPVAIIHQSRDRQWLFIVSLRYAAWVAREAIAEGSRQQVFDYVDRAPARWITGARVRTVFTPEAPSVSEIDVDMGVRLPLATGAADVVNGQNAYTAWPVLLPVRADDGSLRFAAALIPKIASTSATPLPLTRRNVLRQAFRFLGERYGWGHDYGSRDCSGFVSEVYRSMGVQLPRNTGDQARSPALARLHPATAAERQAALRSLRVGDLVYLPGHVMLVIGRIGQEPYVIHDIHRGNVRDANGALRPLHLNAVSVTPLTPLRFDDGTRFVDRVTDIVRIRAAP